MMEYEESIINDSSSSSTKSADSSFGSMKSASSSVSSIKSSNGNKNIKGINGSINTNGNDNIKERNGSISVKSASVNSSTSDSGCRSKINCRSSTDQYPSEKTPYIPRIDGIQTNSHNETFALAGKSESNSNSTAENYQTSGGMGRHLGIFSTISLMYVYTQLAVNRQG